MQGTDIITSYFTCNAASLTSVGISLGDQDGHDSDSAIAGAGVGVMTSEAGTQTDDTDTQEGSSTTILAGGMVGVGESQGSETGEQQQGAGAVGGLGATIIVDNSRVEELEGAHALLVSTPDCLRCIQPWI